MSLQCLSLTGNDILNELPKVLILDAAEVSEPQNRGFLCCAKAWDVVFWAGKEGTDEA